MPTLLNIIDTYSHLDFSHATKRSYLHGDLYSRHVLIDPITSLPTGLIDWGDTHIGHPGIDLAIGMIFTPDIFEIFLEAYGGVDQETLTLLLFHAFCCSISFLSYASEQNKASFQQWATMVLSRACDSMTRV